MWDEVFKGLFTPGGLGINTPLRKLHRDLVALSSEGVGTEAEKARRFYPEEFYERACGEKEADYD